MGSLRDLVCRLVKLDSVDKESRDQICENTTKVANRKS